MNRSILSQHVVTSSIFAAVAACTVALAGCLAALTGCASNAATSAAPASSPTAQPSVPTITVTANSSVKAVPDKAQIGVAVTTQAGTAADAQTQNATAVNAVSDALLAFGIDEKSIQTTSTYLNPLYDYTGSYTIDTEPATAEIATPNTEDESEDVAMAESTVFGSNEGNIYGYEMTTRLSVKDLAIDQVGEAIQAAVAAGANNADGIQYYSSEYDAKYQEALQQAVADARVKAEALAQASGVKLGGIYSLVEGYQNMTYAYDSGVAIESAASDTAMKVMPGEVEIDANVTVSYEIS